MRAPGWVESVLLLLPMRVVLGGAFLLAGWMKLFHGTWAGKDPTFAFAESIKAYKILDPTVHAHAIVTGAYVMPWAELIAGALVLLGVWTRSAGVVVAVLLGMFTAANLSVVLRPDVSASCACFGSIDWPCGSGAVGWCQVLRNAAMLVMALYLVVRGGGLAAFEREGGLDAPRASA